MYMYRKNILEHHISIVMPVCNRAQFISEAIESVLNQEYGLYELIIVDDGSTNPDVENVFNEYRHHLQITIYKKQKGGPGSAVNFGAVKAKNGYFCRLDSDDKLTTDALQVLNRYINRYPEVSYFYSSRYVIDEKSRNKFAPWTIPDGIHKSQEFERENLLKENFCNHLICWKKEDFQKAGGMREDMSWSEDWDLALRMAERYQFQNITEVLYFVREYSGERLTSTVDESTKSDLVEKLQERARRREIVRLSGCIDQLRSKRGELEKKTKHVLIFNNVVGLYGGEISIFELSRSLRNFTPIVVLPKKGPLQALLEKAKVKVLIHDFERGIGTFKQDLECFAFLKETIEKYDIDILHLNKCFSYLAEARIISWLKKIPMIVHVRGAIDIGHARKQWLSKADRILFVSRHSRDYLIKNERSNVFDGMPKESIEVVYDGRALEQFRYSDQNRINVRRQFDIKDEEVVIALAGYIDPLKGQDRFVNLASALMQERKNFKFLIIGELTNNAHKVYYEDIVRKIDSYGLKEKILLTGFLDCRKALSAVDILVSLSDSEGLPGIIIEAMAAERVVVANGVGGIPEIIGNEEVGYIVEKNNIQLMKDFILRLTEDQDLRTIIGKKARERVENLFSIEQHAMRMEQVYELLRVGKLYESALEQKRLLEKNDKLIEVNS